MHQPPSDRSNRPHERARTRDRLRRRRERERDRVRRRGSPAVALLVCLSTALVVSAVLVAASHPAMTTVAALSAAATAALPRVRDAVAGGIRAPSTDDPTP